MLSKNISYTNFKLNVTSQKKILKIFKKLIKSPNQVLLSLSSIYKDSYNKKTISKLNKYTNLR